MDSPTWLEAVSAIGSLLGGLGLFAAAAGLIYLARQTRASERAATAAVYQSIVELGNSINDMFVERPELYHQIFSAIPVPTDARAEEMERADPRLFFAASKWLDYFETILVLWQSIPMELHQPWHDYIKSHLANSPYLQHLVLRTPWYGPDLKRLCPQVPSAN